MTSQRYETRWAWRHPWLWLRIMWQPVSLSLIVGCLALVATRDVFAVLAGSWLWPVLIGSVATALLASTFAPLHADLQMFAAVCLFAVGGLRTLTFLWVLADGGMSSSGRWVAVTLALHWLVLTVVALRLPLVLEELGREVAASAGWDDRGRR